MRTATRVAVPMPEEVRVPSFLEDGNATFRRRTVTGPRRVALAVAAVMLALIAALAIIGLPATLDGRPLMVRPGTTPSRVMDVRAVKVASGDLVAAKDGRVLRAGGGQPPALSLYGSVVASSAQLVPFQAYGIKRGVDVTETTRTETKTVEPKTVYKGTGSAEMVINDGRKGVGRTVYGTVSGDVLSSEWLVAASPRIIERANPSKYAASTGGKIRGGGKRVALTFDDGPDPRYTPTILKILKAAGVRATFFMLSSRVQSNPALAKQVKAEGHLVANHSRTHRDMTTLKRQELEAEFRRSQETIASITGVAPRYFRTPYGAVNAKVAAEARRKKVQLVGWEVDSTDWTKPGTKLIVKRATPNRGGGVVVLMHDSGGNRAQTVAALPAIIKTYKQRGYRFVTVDDFYR